MHKVARKSNRKKSVAFLYTNNEQSKKWCKKTVPFITSQKKRIKYLEISLTKVVKDIYWKLQNDGERN